MISPSMLDSIVQYNTSLKHILLHDRIKRDLESGMLPRASVGARSAEVTQSAVSYHLDSISHIVLDRPLLPDHCPPGVFRIVSLDHTLAAKLLDQLYVYSSDTSPEAAIEAVSNIYTIVDPATGTGLGNGNHLIYVLGNRPTDEMVAYVSASRYTVVRVSSDPGYVCKKEFTIPTLTHLQWDNLVECGDNFGRKCKALVKLSLPALQKCGLSFCINNTSLTTLNLPMLNMCGYHFCHGCSALTTLNLPMLNRCDTSFCGECPLLATLNLPMLCRCDNNFCLGCPALTTLDLPILEVCGDIFCYKCSALTTLNLPMLRRCGVYFCGESTALTTLDLPVLEQCNDYFGYKCSALTNMKLPMVKQCNNGFCLGCSALMTLDMPMLEQCDDYFLREYISSTTPDIQLLQAMLSSYLHRMPYAA